MDIKLFLETSVGILQTAYNWNDWTTNKNDNTLYDYMLLSAMVERETDYKYYSDPRLSLKNYYV